jgi:hypothetical protein
MNGRIVALALVMVAARTSAAAPTAFWVSEPVNPGETVLMIGDDLGACAAVRVARMPDGPPATPADRPPRPPAETVSVAPLEVRPQSVKFPIPPDFAPGLFHAAAATPDGVAEVWINRPRIWWVQGDAGGAGTPGGFVRAFGVSLSAAGRETLVRLEGEGRGLTLKPDRAEPFTVSAPLPPTVPPGSYKVYVHGGAGGAAGWSDPVSVEIRAPPSAPTGRIDVKALGACGDGSADDTEAIRRALLAAGEKGGGTVYLPRGRYLLSATLKIPPQVTLAGEGMAVTALCFADTDAPPEALLRGSHDFAVRDLTIQAANYRHGIAADLAGETGHVRILRVRLRLNPYRGHLHPEAVAQRFAATLKLSTGGGDSLRLAGEAVEVGGCDIDGAGRSIYLTRGAGAWIHDNVLSNGRWGWYCLSGNDRVVFERNEVRGGDLMSTGGGLNCLDGATVSQNVYFADNTLKRMYGWDREAMTTDAGGGAYYGRVAAAKGTALVLAGDPTWSQRDWAGAGVFVLEGRGQGQYRQIVKTAGRTVEVDAPWAVPPDATSVITITMLQRNYLFVRNVVEDAGIALQMYGTSIGHIAYGNTSVRTGGFVNRGMSYYGPQPSWFVQWLGNRIAEGNTYAGGSDLDLPIAEARLAVLGFPPGGEIDAPLTLGAIVRGNHLEDDAYILVGGPNPPGKAPAFPCVQDVVVEKNRVENASTGLEITRASAGVLARDNAFVNCAVGIANEPAAERRAEARRRELAADPGPLLHLPCDAFDGKTLRDATGHGFDAQCSGSCATSPDGAKNGCVVLDGNSYLVVAHPELFRLESFTVATWMRTDRLAGRWGLVAKRLRNAAAPLVLSESDGKLVFEAADPSGHWLSVASPAILKAGTWHHLCAVVRAGEGVTLYVDGHEVARKELKTPLVENDEPLVIGREAWGGDPPSGGKPALFEGRLDEVKVWDRALPEADVARLAARP